MARSDFCKLYPSVRRWSILRIRSWDSTYLFPGFETIPTINAAIIKSIISTPRTCPIYVMYIHMIFSGHKCNICEGGAAQKYGENLQGDQFFWEENSFI